MDAYRGLNPSWVRVFGFRDYDRVCSVSLTTDGGYVIAGTCSRLTIWGSDDVFVIQLDAAGNVVWQKLFERDGSDEAASIAATASGGFAVAGKVQRGRDLAVGMFLKMLDGLGNPLWERTFEVDCAVDGQILCVTQDGGYALLGAKQGWFRGAAKSQSAAVLLKTNSNGELEWERSYPEDGFVIGQWIEETRDKGFVACGSIEKLDGKHCGGRGFVVRTDGSGELVWKKMLDEWEVRAADAIVETSDGGFLVATKSDTGDRLRVLKLAPSGVINWERGYVRKQGSVVIEDADLGFTVAGSSFVAGSGEQGTGSWHMAALALGPGGEHRQEAVLVAGGGGDFITSMKALPTGGYIAVGTTASFGSIKVIVMKLPGW